MCIAYAGISRVRSAVLTIVSGLRGAVLRLAGRGAYVRDGAAPQRATNLLLTRLNKYNGLK